jgi:hypothetical protein
MTSPVTTAYLIENRGSQQIRIRGTSRASQSTRHGCGARRGAPNEGRVRRTHAREGHRIGAQSYAGVGATSERRSQDGRSCRSIIDKKKQTAEEIVNGNSKETGVYISSVHAGPICQIDI